VQEIIDDPHHWLEEIHSEKSLEWVRKRNKTTLDELKKNSLYHDLERDLRSVHMAKDRLAAFREYGNFLYNFWQDEIHVKGIWRRMKVADYRNQSNEWELLLDIDALTKVESENWVFSGTDFLAPDFTRCLIFLSRGGKDAKVVREFDLISKSFVSENAFCLPESKSRVSWIDRDTLFLGFDFGSDSLTRSGYPKDVRIWKRGQSFANAKLVFSGEHSDVSTTAFRSIEFDALNAVSVIIRMPTFFESLYYLFDHETETYTHIPLPSHASMKQIFDGYIYFQLRKAWSFDGQTFAQGSLVRIAIANVGTPKFEAVWIPSNENFFMELFSSQTDLFLSSLENVQSRVYHLASIGNDHKLELQNLDLPKFANISILSCSSFSKNIFLIEQSFLIPPTILEIRKNTSSDGNSFSFHPLKKLPSRFDETKYEVRQFFAKSSDGEKIPYFCVSSKELKYDSSAPTFISAYGGFEVSKLPQYLANVGVSWLNHGGVFVLANIRGGGEYGPRWHQAALRENRQNAFNDLYAVAEDLIQQKITSSKHLGAMGGSNGGLLMGVALTQRPELFSAIVCQVPLLDMLRFHKLLAGHSWTAEYGNPDSESDKIFIEKYSPYQNLRNKTKYPRAFFVTSTADDRVHPGHARKMAARLEELGQEIFYFENLEGGHAAGADPEQIIKRQALEYTYLHQMLR